MAVTSQPIPSRDGDIWHPTSMGILSPRVEVSNIESLKLFLPGVWLLCHDLKEFLQPQAYKQYLPYLLFFQCLYGFNFFSDDDDESSHT